MKLYIHLPRNYVVESEFPKNVDEFDEILTKIYQSCFSKCQNLTRYNIQDLPILSLDYIEDSILPNDPIIIFYNIFGDPVLLEYEYHFAYLLKYSCRQGVRIYIKSSADCIFPSKINHILLYSTDYELKLPLKYTYEQLYESIFKLERYKAEKILKANLIYTSIHSESIIINNNLTYTNALQECEINYVPFKLLLESIDTYIIIEAPENLSYDIPLFKSYEEFKRYLNFTITDCEKYSFNGDKILNLEFYQEIKPFEKYKIAKNEDKTFKIKINELGTEKNKLTPPRSLTGKSRCFCSGEIINGKCEILGCSFGNK